MIENKDHLVILRTGSVVERAGELDRYLQEKLPGKEINFIAHSMVCNLIHLTQLTFFLMLLSIQREV